MRSLRLCVLLAVASPTACLLLAPHATSARHAPLPRTSQPASQRRAPPPTALLSGGGGAADAAAMAAAAAATGAANAVASSSSLLLAADPDFGEVFLAGMSIAFAAIGTTVFVGILVNGKYDAVEKSFFDAQDDALANAGKADEKADEKSRQVVSDFFGDVNPSEATSKDEV